MKLFNTLTREVEPLKPIRKGEITLYACGPTVYNFAHIGNFRTFVSVDILRRYLTFREFKVKHVMNITDVDDKTINGSKSENLSLNKFTEKYTNAFLEDFDTLNIETPNSMPKATKYIAKIIKLIEKLLKNGNAYEKDGSIYFKIDTFKDYGKLANIDVEGLLENADGRMNDDEYDKDNARDFALWKAFEDSDGEVYWDSPWGKGRPGWHIECSTMSMDKLGETFDIHAGGTDLMFPHHTNEIAQSECASKKKFVNLWFHVEHLQVEGKKMSKSLGNFYTLRDLLEKGYSGREIRYLLISSHYKNQLNFTFKGLDAARKTLERFDEFILKLQDSDGKDSINVEKVKKDFTKAMDEDLNMSDGLSVVFEFMRETNKKNLDKKTARKVLDLFYDLDNVFGLNFKDVKRIELDSDIQQLVDQREEARKNKDFAKADSIRDQLKEIGIALDDTPKGVKWKRI